MQLQPAAFNAFLNTTVKQTFAWRRAFACPCRNPNSGAARPNCVLCSGKAWLWDAEVNPCRAGMTNQTTSKSMKDFGVWEPGDAVFTIPSDSPLYACGQNDRIRCLDATSPFSLALTRGLQDKLYGSIVSIERVFWLADDGASIVEGGLPDVGDDGALSWRDPEAAPPADKQYSVTGIKHDEFFVYLQLPSDRNSGVSGLPRKLMARKFDLFGR